MKINQRKKWAVLGAMLVSLAAIPSTAFAGATGLPWEGPLAKLKDSLTGPVAQIICLVAIVAIGATLIWGGEMSDVTRKLMIFVLVAAVLLGGGSFMASMFGTTGALI